MITRAGSAALARALLRGPVSFGLGIGAGDHPESHAQSALAADGVLGASWYRPADAGFPFVMQDGSLLLQATYDWSEANFCWREWCVFVADGPVTPHHEMASAAAGAVMVSRRLPAVPLHPAAKSPEGQKSWVLRVPVRFFTPD